MIEIAEAEIPSAVLIKASEIPVERATASSTKVVAMAENERSFQILYPTDPEELLQKFVDKITRFFFQAWVIQEKWLLLLFEMASTFALYLEKYWTAFPDIYVILRG